MGPFPFLTRSGDEALAIFEKEKLEMNKI